ncbi:hypothetical protein [Methanoculleus sp.]|jgi:sorbitol-specific phosphotransferase system component IIC|uniref:hypothetical protein n=1 Tax=Methanoculleus sp. TaxID=90427 RepID=UPI0025F0506B|nr:hypothetical protein [Methanoculleus sp.]MCK9320286.1 hypothetical protein [Methanoculleus sp.]
MIPFKILCKKFLTSLFDYLGSIELDVFTGIFISLFLMGLQISALNSFLIGVPAYFIFIRLEETLFKALRIMKNKKEE